MKFSSLILTAFFGASAVFALAQSTVVQPPEAVDPSPINGESYYLINQQSGLQVDVNGSSRLDDDSVTQNTRSFSSLRQRWAMTRVADGAWKISNISSGLCLDAGLGSRDTFTTVQKRCGIGVPTQEWEFIYTTNGYNTIRNVGTRRVLDASAPGVGSKLVQSVASGNPKQSQLWLFRAVFWRGDDMSLGEKAEVARVTVNTNQLPWWHDAYNPGQDIMQIFKNSGLNSIRLRPASINTTIVYGKNSFTMTAAPYNNYTLAAGTSTTFPLSAVTQIIPASVPTGSAGGGGTHAQTDWSAVDLCHRAKQLGMSCFLDLFYNGSNGEVPGLWNGDTIEQIAGVPSTPGGACETPGGCLMYNYVFQEIELFRSNGAMPDMVGIGNEVNDGLFQAFGTFSLSPAGTNATPNTAGTPDASFANFAAVQKAAMQAIVDASIDTNIGQPLPPPLRCIDPDGNPWLQTFLSTTTQYYGVPVDNICASYYPGWHGPMTQAAHDWHATGPNTTTGQIWEANVDTEASGLGIPIYNGEDGVAYTNSGSPLDVWYGSALAPPAASRTNQREYYIDQTRVEKNEPNNLGMGMDCWSCEATTIVGATGVNAFYTNGYLGLFDMTTTTGSPLVNAVLPDMMGLGGKVDPTLSYKFVNAETGQILASASLPFGGQKNHGTPLVNAIDTGVLSLSQQWQILPQGGDAELNDAVYPAPMDHLGDGFFQIISMDQRHGLQVLDINGDTTAGSPVVETSETSAPNAIAGTNANQEWDIITAGNCGDIPKNCTKPPLTATGDYYMIVNKASGLVLATAETGRGWEQQTAIEQQAPAAASNGDFMLPANKGQLWQIFPVHITAAYPTALSSVWKEISRLAYNPSTRAWDCTLTIRNSGQDSLEGPFQIVFSSLTGGVSLLNAEDTFNGSPYVTVPGIVSLDPGQSATVDVHFNNPSSSAINFTPVAYGGNF